MSDRQQRLTLRQAVLEAVTPKWDFIDAGATVAGEIVSWIDSEIADKFILRFPVTAKGFGDFDRLVLRELKARGRSSRAPICRMLRDHLDLLFKANGRVVRRALATE